MIPIPTIGETYKFWDDGKMAESRIFDAKVLSVLSPDEAKKEMVKFVHFDEIESENQWTDMSLYDIYLHHVDEDIEPYIYCKNTDAFIECSIPKYDKNPIWFVRGYTDDLQWFSFYVQNFWQCGLLDVTEDQYASYLKCKKEYAERYGK